LLVLTGRITRDGADYLAECDVIGAFTQGTSRKDAMAMLADCIETMIDPTRIRVRVTEAGEESHGVYSVRVDADNLGLLAATVLVYQRERHKLTRAQVAKRVSSTAAAYASLEDGTRQPSLTQFCALLAAIAPELALTVGPRMPRKPQRGHG
jgi:DNA-binding XRE family transcriptional regulator